MTDLTFFSVDSHERVFYYVDHSMSSIKTVNMITKIEQILYVGTVGAETISGMYYLFFILRILFLFIFWFYPVS
jgi:hypothetical protein